MSSEFKPAEYAAGVASMIHQEAADWGVTITMDEQSRIADEIYRALSAARARNANNILEDGV